MSADQWKRFLGGHAAIYTPLSERFHKKMFEQSIEVTVRKGERSGQYCRVFQQLEI